MGALSEKRVADQPFRLSIGRRIHAATSAAGDIVPRYQPYVIAATIVGYLRRDISEGRK